MLYLLKKTFLVVLLLMLVNVLFVQLSGLDDSLLRDMSKAFLLAILIQPWVIRQLEG